MQITFLLLTMAVGFAFAVVTGIAFGSAAQGSFEEPIVWIGTAFPRVNRNSRAFVVFIIFYQDGRHVIHQKWPSEIAVHVFIWLILAILDRFLFDSAILDRFHLQEIFGIRIVSFGYVLMSFGRWWRLIDDHFVVGGRSGLDIGPRSNGEESLETRFRRVDNLTLWQLVGPSQKVKNLSWIPSLPWERKSSIMKEPLFHKEMARRQKSSYRSEAKSSQF